MHGGNTIVIVDDEAEIAEMHAEMVRLKGFEAVIARDNYQALEAIRRNVPVAILLDIMMPGKSGIELLKELRRTSGLNKIPVIIISARNMPADIKAGIDAGASAYLTKPIAYMDLVNAVNSVVAASSAA